MQQIENKGKRSLWFGLAAYLGTFLFIPLWDVFALGYSLVVGFKNRRADTEAFNLMVEPIRRLLFLAGAYILALRGFNIVSGRVLQPGPFGFLVTGARNYPQWAIVRGVVPPTQDFRFSTIVAEGQLVTDVIARNVTTSMNLIVAASIIAGILVALIIAGTLYLRRFTRENYTPGVIIGGLLKLGGFRLMAAPTMGIGLTAFIFLAINWGLFPVGGAGTFEVEGSILLDRIKHLILPGTIIALLPSLLTAQAGLRAWDDWIESGYDKEDRYAILGLEVARAFYEQAGWLLGSLLVVEAIFLYPGLGATLHASITRQDTPLLVGVLAVFPFWLMLARVRTIAAASADRAFRFGKTPELKRRKKETSEETLPLKKIWLGIAGGIIALLIIFNIVGTMRTPYSPRDTDPGSPYAGISEEHPKGTDFAGRDVQARLLQSERITFFTALGGVMVLLVVGGIWGGTSALLKAQGGVLKETLADLIRIPAEAAILIHPTLIVLVFTVARTVGRGEFGQSLTSYSSFLAMALVPRAAWAVEALWNSLPEDRSLRWRLSGFVAVFMTGALFVIWQYTVATSFLGLGIQPGVASLGNNLNRYADMLAAAITGGTTSIPYYLILVAFTGAAGIQGFAIYLLYDAVTDFFGIKRRNFLPRLFS